MRDSCDTEPSLVVVSGGRKEAIESIDIILGFLLTDIIINQKSIDTFQRLRDGSLGSSCFRFWLNVETGSEKAVALAYSRGGLSSPRCRNISSIASLLADCTVSG